jgi:Tfp pilus assembly protein PilX
MKRRTDNRGFALVAALLANLILLAVGIVALNLSTGDIRISMKTVGDKKAINATYATLINTNNLVDDTGDPNTRYVINSIAEPTTGPAQIPLPGFSIGGSQTWGQARYDARITGANTAYNSTVSIDVGLGHGPVEMGTMSR